MKHSTQISDLDNWTPLHYATTLEITKLLIENGAEVHLKNDDNWTSLHSSTSLEIITNLLVEKGAEVNLKSENNWTPLPYATILEISNILMESGTEINAKNKNGHALFELAVLNGHHDIAAFLLTQQGASIRPFQTQI